MSNTNYFEQYEAQQQRIRDQIAAERNPYHKQHIAEFSQMMDERIQAVVPQMIQEQQENVRVNVETYMNGKRVKSDKDIVKGLKDLMTKVFSGKRR